MAESHSDAEAQMKVWDMIEKIGTAMMVTMDEQGRFRSRPMQAAAHERGDVLWFFTDAHSPKVAEAKSDERVLLAYSDPDSQNYCSVGGTLEVVRDAAKQKELWKEPMRVWFPKGSEDPGIALLKVTVDGAEFWDAPSSTLLYAYGYLKAVTTGARPQGGENEKVRFPLAS